MRIVILFAVCGSLLGPGCSASQPAWQRHEVELEGVGLRADFVAAPKRVGDRMQATRDGFTTSLEIIGDPELSRDLKIADDSAGKRAAPKLSERRGRRVTYRSYQQSLAGLVGILFRESESGGGDDGLLLAVSSGNSSLVAACWADGGLGVGKRMKQLNESICPRFFSSVSFTGSTSPGAEGAESVDAFWNRARAALSTSPPQLDDFFALVSPGVANGLAESLVNQGRRTAERVGKKSRLDLRLGVSGNLEGSFKKATAAAAFFDEVKQPADSFRWPAGELTDLAEQDGRTTGVTLMGRHGQTIPYRVQLERRGLSWQIVSIGTAPRGDPVEDPTPLPPSDDLPTTRSKAQQHVEARELAEAGAAWDRYLRSHPQDAEALFERARVHFLEGQTEDAKRLLTLSCGRGRAEACEQLKRLK